MIDIADDGSPIDPQDYMTARGMAEALHQHYPGQRWAVTCDGQTGIATIRNLFLSGVYGYVLKLPAIYSASEFKKEVVRAGGEVLERFKMARGEFKEDAYNALPTNFAGQLGFDA